MADLAAISVYVRRAAGQAGVQAVVAYAADRNFRVTAVPARHCVMLRGMTDELSAAFAPNPAELAAQIEAVLGLEAEDAPAVRAAVAIAAGKGDALGTLAASLGLPDGDGAGHCLGLLNFSGRVGQSTLADACKALGIAAPATAAHLIAVDAGSTMSERADGPLLPMLLVLAALVPKAKIVVYSAPATLRGWVDALSAAIHDADNKPLVICNGFLPPGSCAMAATLAAQATALRIDLFQATEEAGTRSVAAPTAGQAWSGSAIDAVVQAAARLRAAPPPVAAPVPSAPPPTRPHFDATTQSANPAAVRHRASIAFETDPYPGARTKGAFTLPWALLPGSVATDIAVGGDGSLWALSGLPVVGGYALFHLTAFGWRAAFAAGIALAVDAHGLPWLVDAAGSLLHFNGTDWRVVRDGLHDVAVTADGALWALAKESGTGGRAVLHRPAPGDGEDSSEWVEDAMHAERITVAPDGTPWIVTLLGEAMRLDGTIWVTEASNVHDVAVDEHDRVWVVSRCGRRLYCRVKVDEGWVRGDGVADRVVTQPGGWLWAVTPQGYVAAARVVEEASEKAA
jgi:hypothetical protein